MRIAATLILSAAALSTAGCGDSATTAGATPRDVRDTAGSAASTSSASRAVDVAEAQAPETREAHRAPAAGSDAVIETTFDDVKFDMEKGEPFERSMLTPEIEQLFNRRIRIRGYILPTFKQRGLKEFVLVRDNMECCFGPGAALFDCMLVRMEDGKTADFSIRPVTVEGTLRFEEFKDPVNDSHLAIFSLEGESVD